MRLCKFILHRDPEVIQVSSSWSSSSGHVKIFVKTEDLLDRSIHRDVWSVVAGEIRARGEVLQLTPLIYEASQVASQLADRAVLLLYPRSET